MEQTMQKTVLEHDVYKELLIRLAEREVLNHFTLYNSDGTSYMEEDITVNIEGEEHYTDVAQEVFNEKYDEIEAIINEVGIFSKWYLENNL